MKIHVFLSTLALLTAFSLIQCKKEKAKDVDPNDPQAIAEVLVISGDEKKGAAPTASSATTAPAISNNQPEAIAAPDNRLYLPFSFTTNPDPNKRGYAGCYVQVIGADFFWDIPAATANTDLTGQIVVPVGIPSNVLPNDGCFTIAYCIYNADGEVSNVLTTQICVGAPRQCPFEESGSVGLSIFTYELGETAGTCTIDYDTYSIPDRIDVFYNGKWVTGTSSTPLNINDFPPTQDYSDYLNNIISDGFIGDYGELSFAYDPKLSTKVNIYVSGCLNSSTAWDLFVHCPQ